jgi:hypothetical protein
MLSVITLSVIVLSVIRVNVIMLGVILMTVFILRVIMLIVVLLSVIILNAIMFSVIMLSVIMLRVIILSVIMLSVLAPHLYAVKCTILDLLHNSPMMPSRLLILKSSKSSLLMWLLDCCFYLYAPWAMLQVVQLILTKEPRQVQLLLLLLAFTNKNKALLKFVQ